MQKYKNLSFILSLLELYYSENSFLTQNRSKSQYISSKNIFFTTFVDTKTKSAGPNRAPPARLFQKLYNMSIPLNTTLPPTGKHLLVNLRKDGIYFATFDPLEDDTYQSYTIDFIAKNQTLCENVKNSIYENPQLLQEYDRTYLLVDTPRFTLVPEEMETCEENRTPYYDFCYPGHNDYIVENRLTLNRAYLLFGLDRELYTFLCRTFPAATVLHPLTPLSEYFFLHSRNGNEAKVYLHLRQERFDLIVFKQGRLLLANTFDFTTVDDIAYFTLLSWKQLSLDQARDRLYLAGEKSMRQPLTEILQKYLKSVLPYPFPSQLFRIGKETIDAPFELITIPLCGL